MLVLTQTSDGPGEKHRTGNASGGLPRPTYRTGRSGEKPMTTGYCEPRHAGEVKTEGRDERRGGDRSNGVQTTSCLPHRNPHREEVRDRRDTDRATGRQSTIGQRSVRRVKTAHE